MTGTRIASTMWAPDAPAWQDVTVVDHRDRPRSKFLLEALRASKSHDVLIVNGALGRTDWYRDLQAAALVLRAGRGTRVVIAEATWEPGSRALARMTGREGLAYGNAARRAIRLLDSPRAVYCVLSRIELETFPRLWGIDPQRVFFTPYSYRLWGEETEPTGEGNYVFAGGTPLRDHETLSEAARGLGTEVRIATRARLRDLPPNVAAHEVSHGDYLRLLRGAGAVVVSLAATTCRSAGQQTYLAAMALGKPLIVTDAPGVRDYVVPEETGIVVPPGDVPAMRRALVRVTDPAQRAQLAPMRERAREVARAEYSPARYWERLRRVAEQVARRGG